MIGQTISHYRILEKIGQGGMGEVYLAEDTELHRKVAIKFLPGGFAADPDVLARFKREARAAASLSHPNIITIHEVAEHEGRPYIVMAYVDGAPLSTLIAGRSLALDRVLDYAMQMAEGLDKAHRAGVVHRDIKPDNIIIDSEGHAKILDFGLAKLGGLTKLTNETSTLGTVYYMSPEQARGADVDHRSDIFSLGAVLYEMITGQLPFHGEHPAAVTYSIINEEPQPLARFNNQATPELQRIVSKTLAKDPAERYQSAADLVADLRHERRLSVSGVSAVSMPVVPPAPRRRVLRFVIPASIVGVAAALLLIFKPFTFEFSPDQPVVAAENTLAIMYFENKVDRHDEKRLGEILTDLLITDLSESSALKVLSSQRLYDILKLEGKEGLKSLDPTTSTEVAKRAGVKWMLIGSILQVEPVIVVTSQLVDVETGAVASSQRVHAESGENVFTVADRLSSEIRSDMAVPVAALATRKEPGIKVSTQSQEAYRYYLEGLDYDNQLIHDKAEQSFFKALEYDSTFAMAYFRLSWFRSREEARPLIEKARQYANNVSERERLWIDAVYARVHDDVDMTLELLTKITELFPEDKEAYYQLGRAYVRYKGNVQEGIRYYRKAIEIDPLYKLAYNNLAYAYDVVGDLDQSIWAINKYIELAPDEFNPYDTRADLYAWNGKVDEAIASYKKALEINPNSDYSRTKLGHMYRAKRDYAAAESSYRRLLNTEDPMARSYARFYLAAILAYQGRLTRALEQLEEGMAADRIEKNDEQWGYYDKLILKGSLHELQGDYAAALAVTGGLPREDEGEDPADELICHWSALSGDFDRAERAAGTLKELSDSDSPPGYHLCRGTIAFARGRFDDAVAHFEQSLGYGPPRIWTRFPLARAYQEGDRLSDAVRQYEAILTRYDDGWATDPTIAATMHYYAGLAYQASGWNDRAIERYEEFLSIWKDADPDIEIVDDAKQRLESLRQGS